MEKIAKYSLIFISLMLLQILVFNNVPAVGIISPYLYVAFIIILPVNMSASWVMLLAFLSGFVIDLSTHSLGVHASASVFMAFCRPTILRIMAPRIGYESNNSPIVAYYGLSWALKYTAACVLTHHLLLYLCFTFSFADFGFLFIRVIINIILTVFIIMLSELFMFKR